jgi:lipopolysaccharide transport system permease protein
MLSSQIARRAVWRPLWELPRHLDLVRTMTRREVALRYKGSVLGIMWAVLTPLMLIAIFTFIFAGVFRARFGTSGSGWDYALYLFCGLLPWTAFQEAVQSASQTVVQRANLVKRVVFPLEILPVAQALASLVNQMFGTLVFLAATLVIRRELHLSILWLPVLIVPQLVATFGVAWFISSVGVFLRDVVQGVTLVLMAWMYLTPIIYPESIVPERYRPLVNLNPFAGLIRSYRNTMLEGAPPDWAGLAYFTAFALCCFFAGYWWFAKTRRHFADVI